MVTHDGQVAAHTERVLLLKDGRILKEKQGLHSAKKKLMCPHCGSKIQIGDSTCPSCQKKLNR
jgi:rubrerythrin